MLLAACVHFSQCDMGFLSEKRFHLSFVPFYPPALYDRFVLKFLTVNGRSTMLLVALCRLEIERALKLCVLLYLFAIYRMCAAAGHECSYWQLAPQFFRAEVLFCVSSF